jgi:hypothetical protein
MQRHQSTRKCLWVGPWAHPALDDKIAQRSPDLSGGPVRPTQEVHSRNDRLWNSGRSRRTHPARGRPLPRVNIIRRISEESRSSVKGAEKVWGGRPIRASASTGKSLGRVLINEPDDEQLTNRSLSNRSGHGPSCCRLNPVAHDPNRTSAPEPPQMVF